MKKVPPVVRHFVLCEEVVVAPEYPDKVSLLNLIYAIRSRETPAYPLLNEEFAAFVMLTNARGNGVIGLRMIQADSQEEVYRVPQRAVNFGDDPLQVFGLPVRFRNCLFPDAGVYWVQLLFDGEVIAQQDLLMR